MRRAPLLLGLLLGTAVPMGLLAQGVPIIDGSRCKRRSNTLPR